MIRVLVVDDHPVVRAGIVGVLELAEDIEVVGQAEDGREAVNHARELSPDVVLLDLRMPHLDGTAATAEILKNSTSTSVLILTTYESDDHILGAVEAGASGYLLKAAPADEIIAGVRAVAAGQTVLAPTIASALVRHTRRETVQGRTGLSGREKEVLGLVAEGHSNGQIARKLFITEATVKTHLLHVFDKLDVSDRTHAVTKAMKLGVI